MCSSLDPLIALPWGSQKEWSTVQLSPSAKHRKSLGCSGLQIKKKKKENKRKGKRKKLRGFWGPILPPELTLSPSFRPLGTSGWLKPVHVPCEPNVMARVYRSEHARIWPFFFFVNFCFCLFLFWLLFFSFVVVYGVTTGFGKFASVVIPRDKLK